MVWRSAEFEETQYYCGYDLDVITDVPSRPGRGPVVHVARAMNLSPAGANKGRSIDVRVQAYRNSAQEGSASAFAR